MTDPLTLRVRNPADLAQQQHYHRSNALCYALVNSVMVTPLTVPQTIPHGQRKGDTSGSGVAARLEACKENIIEAEQELRRPGLNWEDAERIRGVIERSYERAERLQRELDAIPTASRGTRPGVPGLYSIRVAPLRLVGSMEGECAEEWWTLDTRTLPDDLRGRLDAYLAGGSEAMPYRYRPHNNRYVARSEVSADTRALISSLLGHAVAVIDAEHAALLRSRTEVA